RDHPVHRADRLRGKAGYPVAEGVRRGGRGRRFHSSGRPDLFADAQRRVAIQSRPHQPDRSRSGPRGGHRAAGRRRDSGDQSRAGCPLRAGPRRGRRPAAPGSFRGPGGRHTGAGGAAVRRRGVGGGRRSSIVRHLPGAHVRGGGEYGEDWHLAGKLLTKPNTWRDFIACAEYLIEHKYTAAARLAGDGGSAGGITIGRGITDRPDLFAAALDEVGMSDAVRVELSPNGPPNIPEFGSTKTADGFKGLYEMSAYHHVTDGTAYPAVLLTTGINDPRVTPWQPAKLAARLQAATSSGKPILLRVDYEAGHGIGSTKSQRQELLADQWSFLL